MGSNWVVSMWAETGVESEEEGKVFEENEHTGSGRDKIYGRRRPKKRFNCKPSIIIPLF
jgi:hypothetical protein